MELNLTNPNRTILISKILDTYRVRQSILLASDIFIVIVSFLLSLNIVKGILVSSIKNEILPTMICVISTLTMFYTFRCYSSLWRYAGTEELYQ